MNWKLIYERPDIRGVTGVVSTADRDIVRTLDGVWALDPHSGKVLDRLDFATDHSFGYKPLLVRQNIALTVRHRDKDPQQVELVAIDIGTFQPRWDLTVNWRLSHYGSGLLLGPEHLYLVDNERKLWQIEVATGVQQPLFHLSEARLTEYSFALTGQRLNFIRTDGTVGVYDLQQAGMEHSPSLSQIEGVAGQDSILIAWATHQVHLIDAADRWRKIGVERPIRRAESLHQTSDSSWIVTYHENGLAGYEWNGITSPLFDITFPAEQLPMQAGCFGDEWVVYLDGWEGYRLLSFKGSHPEDRTEILAGDVVRGAVCFSDSGIFLTTDQGLQCLRSDAKLATHG